MQITTADIRLTTTIDFGNLFTDWESELWEVNSNEFEVERRTLQSYSS